MSRAGRFGRVADATTFGSVDGLGALPEPITFASLGLELGVANGVRPGTTTTEEALEVGVDDGRTLGELEELALGLTLGVIVVVTVGRGVADGDELEL